MHGSVWASLAIVAVSACCTGEHDGGHDGRGIVGSGVVVRESRSVSPFHGVRLEGVGRLVLSPAAAPWVEVETDDNLQRRLRTEVVGGTLEIGLDPGSYSDLTLVVRVGAPALDRVELTGAGRIDGTVSDARSLAVRLSGSGDVSLTGVADALTVDVEGTGSFEGYGLVSSTCTARLTGMGRIEVTATDALDAAVTGVGTIRYDGAPATVRTDVTGLGTIARR